MTDTENSKSAAAEPQVGWVLVPVEPTEEMLAAVRRSRPDLAKTEKGREIAERLNEMASAFALDDWRAMLAARPTPATPAPAPSAPAVGGEDHLLWYAQQLATVAAKKAGCLPEWRPLPDVMGCLTQIDNAMTAWSPPPRADAAADDVAALTPIVKMLRKSIVDLEDRRMAVEDLEALETALAARSAKPGATSPSAGDLSRAIQDHMIGVPKRQADSIAEQAMRALTTPAVGEQGGKR